MVIEIDLRSVPPQLVLSEADDMTSFSVNVNQPPDTFVTRALVEELAGDRAGDPEWQTGLETMLGYAATKGCVRASDGAIQAHLTTTA